METKELKLEDVNNKLQCGAFTVIHFAPPAGTVKEKDFNSLFVVKRNDGSSVLVKCVDFVRVKFCQIGSVLTIPATGLEAHIWRREWQRKHENTKDDTEMAVYCYVKERADSIYK